MNAFNKKSFITIVLIFSTIFSVSTNAAVDEFNVNDDLEIDRRYDWVIDINVYASNYLDYPGSKLKPLTKILVTYRLNPRFGDNCGKKIKYEELWYSEEKVVGSRRLTLLGIPSTYQGAIRVSPGPAVLGRSDAIAGAIARLVLDIELKNCVLSAVFLPVDIFDNVNTSLSRFNFYSDKNATGITSTSLRMYSNPICLMDILSLRN